MEQMFNYFRKKYICWKHGHELEFVMNFYARNVELIGARSVWKCKRCNKTVYSNQPYYSEREINGEKSSL